MKFTNPAICARIKEAAAVVNPYVKDIPAEEIIYDVLDKVGVIDKSELSIKLLESQITIADFNEAFSRILTKCFYPVPAARVRVILSILQGKDPFKQSEWQITNDSPNITASPDAMTFKLLLDTMQQNKPIGQLSDLELISKYGKDCSSEVECELLKRSKGRPCIIFKNDDTVDTDNSLILLRKARHQETPSTYAVDSGIKSVYKVGDFPMNVLYECPIHSHILLVDGYCEECGIKWLDFEVNRSKHIFLRMMSESAKIDPINLRAYLQQSFEQLTQLYPKVYMKFVELYEEDKLPTLKRRLSKAKNGDPFRVIHTQY
jgi:hypothetical protein